MATVIMPKMGDAMEEGTLLRWLKDVGQEVAAGEPLAEIETDKVTIEIEAAESGVLTKTLVNEGDTVPIGTTIATIGDEAEVEAPAPDGAAPAAAQAPVAAVAPEAAPVAATANGAAEAAPRPAAAPAETQRQPAVAANGAAAGSGERLRASPLVKRLAAEHAIDLSQITGSGPGGRIVKDDIAALLTGAPAVRPAPAAPETAPVAPAPTAPTPAPAAAPAATGRPRGTARELSRIRRTTGKRMVESKQAAPHFYVTVEVDMAPAAAFRSQINGQIEDDSSKVSFNDLILKAAALALRDFPNLNAGFQDEAHVVDHANIDINVAVAIEGGLIAPFIPDADEKSLGTIARMTKDLISRAREGGLTPEEYQGGTFTISNLGMFDVEEFIAVINPPQAAILAIGSIKQVPVVADGKVVPGQRMNLSLSADHRITDGAEVARYLQAVKRYLQNPMLLALS
jgi:pyruvate dehydrogenase E2 component (dihydrolipoamide acetyltransferase)